MSALQGIIGNICEGQCVLGVKVTHNCHRQLTHRRMEIERAGEKGGEWQDRGTADRQLIGGSAFQAAQ